MTTLRKMTENERDMERKTERDWKNVIEEKRETEEITENISTKYQFWRKKRINTIK